jgi:hypothetical protein
VYYLKSQDGNSSNKAWSSPERWVDNCEKDGTTLKFSENPLTAFSEEYEFVVPANSSAWTLRTPTALSSTSFKGKRLTIGGLYKSSSSRARIRHSITGADVFVEYPNEGLFLDNRSRYAPVSEGIANVKGTVTVTADNKNYAAELYLTEKANTHLVFHGSFKGAEDVYTKVISSQKVCRVTFKDASRYFGTIEVTNLVQDVDATVFFESDFPGTVIAGTNAVIASSGVKISNLIMRKGAALDLENQIEVTESFEHTGSVCLIVHGFEGEETAPRYANISFKMPVEANLDIDDFEFVTHDGRLCIGDSFSKSDDGVITIRVIKPGYVTLLSGDDKSYSSDAQSSMINEENWSDHLWPTNPLVDYVASYNLRTFDSSANWQEPTDDFVFKGHSLTIDGDGTRFIVANRSFRCDDLILRNGANFYKRRYSGIKEGEYHNLTVLGNVTVENSTSLFYVGYYETLTLDCMMRGAGTVCLTSHSGVSTSSPKGNLSIKRSSPEFQGEMVVTIPYNMPADPIAEPKRVTPSFDRNYTTLSLTANGNLGGVLPALNRKAFTIENMSRVQPDLDIASLTLDEPTRGIFIKWVGRLMANEGQTFTVKSPLAVHGTLWKEGEGTLVLANPAPTFGEDAESETPDADATNRTFRVAGGDVKIASADAVNGLDVVFTNGAGRIVLDLDSEDETFRTFGLRNTKADTPFAVEGDVSEIPVVLNFENPPEIGSSRGLVTVTSEDSNPAAKVSRLSFEKSPALYGIIVSREWVENEDGSFTLKATFKDVGMRIVIR